MPAPSRRNGTRRTPPPTANPLLRIGLPAFVAAAVITTSAVGLMMIYRERPALTTRPVTTADPAPPAVVPAVPAPKAAPAASGRRANAAPLADLPPLPPEARAEVDRLASLVKGFAPVAIESFDGELRLRAEQSYAIDDLRGVELDSAPPALRGATPSYPRERTDGCLRREAPYVAREIAPFAMRRFTTVFNYRGNHNWTMQDYAATHGFNTLAPDGRTPQQMTHLPGHVRFQASTNGVDWARWMKSQGVPPDQFGRLAQRDVVTGVSRDAALAPKPGYDAVTIKPRWKFLKPDELPAREWFPKMDSVEERGAAEGEYYAGCARAAAAEFEAALRLGWKDACLAWQPYNIPAWKIEQSKPGIEANWLWNRVASSACEQASAMRVDLGLIYWRTSHLAETLIEIDYNQEYVRTVTDQPRLRPRYHPFVSSGGGGWRWWGSMPIPVEDMQAMVVCALLSGVEGVEYDAWSKTSNHHVPPAGLKAGSDVMLATGFELAPEGGGPARAFRRYDALHVHELAGDGTVRFQLVHKEDYGRKYRVTPEHPFYRMRRGDLLARVRRRSDCVRGFVEGLALLKPLEATVRAGTPHVDVPAMMQRGSGPVMRRVQHGRLHVIATYDPRRPQTPSTIVVPGFGDHEGFSLWLPADGTVRVFVLEERVAKTAARPTAQPRATYRSNKADPADAAVDEVVHRVAGVSVVDVPARAGTTVVDADAALTIDELRGVPFDAEAPRMKTTPPRYTSKQSHGLLPGQEPYAAVGIAPFRLRHFNCEFNYGGSHNAEMYDYMATHGFRILNRHTVDHLPDGTEHLRWGGGLDWKRLFPGATFERGRYDTYAALDRKHDVVATALRAGTLSHDPAYTHLMIDIEHGALSPGELRKQGWFPKGASAAEQKAFEDRYYYGYALTYLAPIRVARKQGWKNISIYGWYLVPRTWHGLDRLRVDPGSDWQWKRYGKLLYEESDIINNSVYTFYWSPQNVAYTLANIDLTMSYVSSLPEKKPARPYYMSGLHGGGGGWRWWKGRAQPDEEMRAMIATCFFTGVDGFDMWSWSGNHNHHATIIRPARSNTDDPKSPRASVQPTDALVNEAFTCASDRGAEERFARYDALHLLDYDENTHEVRFQKIRPGSKHDGWHESYPVFAMNARELEKLLRPHTQGMRGMVEGMALVKPFEYILRKGTVKIDVPAQSQYRKTSPVVRRVRHGPWHVVITYDPKVIYGGAPRTITLRDFDGVAGRTVVLPADAETRVFVLKDV